MLNNLVQTLQLQIKKKKSILNCASMDAKNVSGTHVFFCNKYVTTVSKVSDVHNIKTNMMMTPLRDC
jgi:hypothetical protein